MNRRDNPTAVAVKDFGSFFAGGTSVTLSGRPQQSVQVARNGPERIVDLNGEYVTGQCYVQYVQQVKPLFDNPVMFWHGGAMTGATWETTPDSRPGWQMFFLRKGFNTYTCDAVERGRSGWSPYPDIYASDPIFRTSNEAWTLFRIGTEENYHPNSINRNAYEGQQFPTAYFDCLTKQLVPRWTDHGQLTLDAYFKALEHTGPVWLIAHSQGANFALEAATRRPELFRGVIAIEPASAPECKIISTTVPHLFVWGDHISASSIWEYYRNSADNYAKKISDAGGKVTTLDLPLSGIKGNSHVPMMDMNSDHVATLVFDWINQVNA